MCGITGTIGLADDSIMRTMTQTIAHRGPDDEGFFVDVEGGVALGHRRLAIIDLSPAGHQPMSYADRYWIIFNGEIYNFAETRAELELCGYHFRSGSDTEVILAAYAQWGTACLEKLRGMFAFAIYDKMARTVFLARDRFGIKPLYYAQVRNVFAFASELKALLASGLISRRLDPQAVWDYLSLGSVPQPRTLLAEVKALLPGHAMLVQGVEVKVWRYWDIANSSARSFPQARTMGYGEAVIELRRLLDEATRLHMIADVPVGAFLSGGIDSSAVVGLMTQQVSTPIRTYSIGFETQHRRLSELQWAKIAADRFHTDHIEVIVTAEDVKREYDILTQAIDQPSLDGTNTYFVSQATRTGVTVSLSGLGGDELFAGYPQFQRFQRSERWNALGVRSGTLADKALTALRGRQPFITATPLARHAAIRCLADETAKYRIACPALFADHTLRPLTDLYRRWLLPELDTVAQVSYVELNGYMANTLLRDADAMSMAHALEVRPVLLDHVLAEFVFALPPDFKLQGRSTKRIFIDAVRDLLPDSIITRPKMGFEMPLWDWLTGPLREPAQAALASAEAATIFSPDFLAHAQAQLSAPAAPDVKLWAYVLLVRWMQSYCCEL